MHSRRCQNRGRRSRLFGLASDGNLELLPDGCGRMKGCQSVSQSVRLWFRFGDLALVRTYYTTTGRRVSAHHRGKPRADPGEMKKQKEKISRVDKDESCAYHLETRRSRCSDGGDDTDSDQDSAYYRPDQTRIYEYR